MARQELQRKLDELDMTISEAKGYSQLLAATQGHTVSLLDLLESTYTFHVQSVSSKYSTHFALRSGCQGGRASLGEAPDRW